MKLADTERDAQLMEGIPDYVADFLVINRMAPTVGDVAEHFGASKSTIHRYLEALDGMGIVPYRGRIGVPASVRIEKDG